MTSLLLECMLEIFRPLITSESIEFANYEEGRSRRRQYDPAFQHKAIRTYFNVFVEVRDSGTIVGVCTCVGALVTSCAQC